MNANAPIHAALVLGSDSFRLLIAGWAEARLHVLDQQHAPLRLAATLDAQGRLSADAVQDALACVRRMRARLDAFPLAGVRAVATSTLRMARNSDQFLPVAQQLLGQPIRVLSGAEEGVLTWHGAAGNLGDVDGHTLVLGVGGGSTQLALGAGARILAADSLALGTARIALTFFGDGRVDAAALAAARESSRAKLADTAAAYGPRRRARAYGSSGTIHTLARLQADNGIDGPLTPASLAALGERVLAHARRAGEDAPALHGIGLLRLRDVAAALAILQALMDELEIDALAPSGAGLRAGLLAELRGEATAMAG